MASSSRSSLSICANIKCGEPMEDPRPGWNIDDGKVEICNKCYVSFSKREYCDIYHGNASRWSFCHYCEKKFHRDCIVSQNWFRKLETGLTICSICEKREAMLIPNSKTTMDTSNPTPTFVAIVAPTPEEDNQRSDEDHVGEEPGERSSPRPLALEHDQNVLSYEAPAQAQVQGFSRKSRGMKEKYASKPRMAYQELNEITECSNVKVTPLFEKMLTASDTRRNGRLVVPKKCAEEYFPSCADSEAKCILIQDSKGKDWYFNFKFWPNNNSRIYVLEGFHPFVKSMKLRVGDTVTFGRLNPEGKLVMGYRKSASAILYTQVGSLQKDTTTSSSNKKGKMCMVTARTKRVQSEKKIIQEVEETRAELGESPTGTNVSAIMVAEGFKIKSKKCMVTARTKRVESQKKIIEEVEETRTELVEPPTRTNVPSIIKSNKSMAKPSTSSQGNVISATTPSMKKSGIGLIGKRVENEKISEEDITSEEDTELVRPAHRSKVPSVMVDKEVEIKSSKDMVSARDTKEVSKGKTTSTMHSTFSKGKSKDPTSVQLGAKRKFSQIGTPSTFSLDKKKGPISVQSNDVKARDHVDGKRKSFEIGFSGKSADNQNKRSEVDLTSKHAQELVCSPCGRNVEIKGSTGMVKTSTSSGGKTISVTTQSMKKCGIGLIGKCVKNENKFEIDLKYEKTEEVVRSRHHSNVPSVMVNKELEIKSSKVSKGKTTPTKHSTFGKEKCEDLTSGQPGAKRKYNQTGRPSIFSQEKQKGIISTIHSENEKAKVVIDTKRKHNQIGKCSIFGQEKRKGSTSVPSENENAKVVVDAKRKHNQIGTLSILSPEKQKGPMSVPSENENAKVVVDAKRKHNQVGTLSILSHEKQKCSISVPSKNENAKVVDAKRKHNQIGTLSILSQEKQKGQVSHQSENGKTKVAVDAKRKHNQIGTLLICGQEKQKDPRSIQPDYVKAKVHDDAKRKYSQIGTISTCSQEKQKCLVISVQSDDVQAKVPIDAKRKSCQIGTPLKSSQEKQKDPINVQQDDDGKSKVPIDAKKKSFEVNCTGKSTENQNKRSKVDLTSKHDQELFFAPYSRNVEIKGSQDNSVVGLTNIFPKHARLEEEPSAKTMKNGSSMMGQDSSNKLQKGNVEPEPVETRVAVIDDVGALLASTKPIKKRPSYRTIVCTQPASGSNLKSSCKCHACVHFINNQDNFLLTKPLSTNLVIKPTEEGNSNPNPQMLISTQATNVPKQVEPLSLNSNNQMLVNYKPENIQKPAEPESSNANQHTTVNGSSQDKQKVKILCDLNLPPEDEDEDDMWMIKLTYNDPF